MATAEQAKKSFNKAGYKKLPRLHCTGYVALVEDGRESKSGNFNTVTVEINGLGGSRNTKVYPCTRPEWFELDAEGNPTFQPSNYDNVEGGKKLQMVYANNISQEGGVSTLQGLCGSEERFDALQEAFLTNPNVADENKSAKAVESILDELLVAKQGEEPFEIGYTLKQQQIKTDKKNAEGKPVYINTKFYEIDTYWEATDKNKSAIRKRVEKAAEKAEAAGEPCYQKVAFDDSVPY